MSINDSPRHLLPIYKSAELTACLLQRVGRPENDPEAIVNGFSVILFGGRPATSEGERFAFLTAKPESSPEKCHRLMVTRSLLRVEEALDLLQFSDRFRDPAEPHGRAVSSPGSWLPTIFVGREEHPLRNHLPYLPYSLWIREHWRLSEGLQDELGEAGVTWLLRRLTKLLGIHVSRHRLGSFLAVFPEERIKMHAQRSADGLRVGIEVRSDPSAGLKPWVLVRGSRNDRLVGASLHEVTSRFTVVPFVKEIDFEEVELYDASTNTILDRESGVPLRGMSFTMNVEPKDVDSSVSFERMDGTTHNRRIHARWGLLLTSHVDPAPSWEVAERLDSIRREQEDLYRRGRLFVYRGGSTERERAVQDVKYLIRTRMEGYLDIWDPYFGGEEAVEFVPSVYDSNMPIRILTSLDTTPEEKHASCTGAPLHPVAAASGPAPRQSSAKELKIRNLKTAVAKLRRPADNLPGLTNIRCRRGSSYFHDRFILTNNACWQLGCSLNQLGGVVSTIVEFPYPDLIQRAFDDNWNQLGPSADL